MVNDFDVQHIIGLSLPHRAGIKYAARQGRYMLKSLIEAKIDGMAVDSSPDFAFGFLGAIVTEEGIQEFLELGDTIPNSKIVEVVLTNLNPELESLRSWLEKTAQQWLRLQI